MVEGTRINEVTTSSVISAIHIVNNIGLPKVGTDIGIKSEVILNKEGVIDYWGSCDVGTRGLKPEER